MAKNQPLQSTFEFTGKTSTDGDVTYNQFIQRDNKGRELSMAATNAMYVHNVTLNEQTKLGDATYLDFRADHPAGDYKFQTKLKDGRVFHGTLTQVAQPEKEDSAEEPTPVDLGNAQQTVTQGDTEDQPSLDQPENTDDEVTVNSADQDVAEEAPSDEEPDSSDEEPESDDEGEDEETDDGDVSEEPIQGSDVIHHDDLYTVQIGQEAVQAQGSVGDIFNTAFDLLAQEDIVQINRNGEHLIRLHREVQDGQYIMTHEPTEALTDEEAAALQSISRRIITGQIRTNTSR